MVFQPIKFSFLNASQMPRYAFVLTFVMLTVIVLVAPVILSGFYRAVFTQTCFYVLIGLMLWSFSRERLILVSALLLAVPFMIIDVVGIATNSPSLLMVSQGVLCGFLFLSILMIGRQVFFAKQADTNMIFGAIMIYLLAGIIWSKLYWLVTLSIPESFKGLDQMQTAAHHLTNTIVNQFNLFYYSFCTITTLGLGDILPVHHYVRLLTATEAMFGQLFVATTIAKVVSVWSLQKTD